MDDFLCNYKIALNQSELDNRAPLFSCRDLSTDLLQSIVYMAMYKNWGACAEDGVARVQVKPSKTIFACRAWASGEAVAMPLTSAKHVRVVDPEKETEMSTAFVATVEDHMGDKTRFTMSQMSTKDFMSLAYLFKVVDKENDANFKLSDLSVSVPVWALPNAPKFTVNIPVVHATTDIKCEDEMVLYIPNVKRETDNKKRKAHDVFIEGTAWTEDTTSRRQKIPEDIWT